VIIPKDIKDILPIFPEFDDISLKNQKSIDWFFSNYQPQISEYTFTNLYSWRFFRPIKISILENSLCIMAKREDGSAFFMPPVGDDDIVTIVETLFCYADKNSMESALYRVPDNIADQLKIEGFSVELDLDNSDYVYLVSDLSELSGRHFDGKRNRIKKCIIGNNPEYKTMTPDIIEQCLDLQTEWCDIRQCKLNPGLASEDEAIKEVFSLMDRLPVFGGVILIDGKIEAFTLAERLNIDTAVVHFEKANPEIDGLYQLINQWFCQNELGKYKYVNREQDLGIEGLRKAKQSYHPHHLVNKYSVWATNLEKTNK
jgi:hypothetical protein